MECHEVMNLHVCLLNVLRKRLVEKCSLLILQRSIWPFLQWTLFTWISQITSICCDLFFKQALYFTKFHVSVKLKFLVVVDSIESDMWASNMHVCKNHIFHMPDLKLEVKCHNWNQYFYKSITKDIDLFNVNLKKI